MVNTNIATRDECIHWTVEPFTKPPIHIRSVQTTPPFRPMSDDESVEGDDEFVVAVEVATDDGAALTLLGPSSLSFES